MKKYIIRSLITIIWLAAIAAIALGYSYTAIAGCVLGTIGLVKAYDLKTLKGKKVSNAFLLFVIWALYVLYISAQIIFSAWLWLNYPITMYTLLIIFLCLYVYIRHKNNSAKAENA